MKMNTTRKYIVLILIGIFLAGGGALAYFWPLDQSALREQYETQKVARGDLSQTVTATGAIKEEATFLLSFPFSGKVENIFVREGDDVKKGASLVALEESSFQFTVEKAKSAFDLAMAELNQKRSPTSEEGKRVVEAQVTKAEASAKLVKDQVASLERQREAFLQGMQEKEKRAKTEIESSRTQLEYTILNTQVIFEGNFIALDKVLWDIDHILGVERTGENDAFEALLKAGGAIQFSQAQEEYINTRSLRNQAQSSFLALRDNLSSSSLGGIIFSTQEALNASSKVLFETRSLLQVSVTGPGLSTSELATLKTTIDSDRTSINNEIQSLATSESNFQDAKNTFSTSEALFAELHSSQELELSSLDKEILNAKNNVAVSLQEVALALANKDVTLAFPREIDLAPFEARVESARVALFEAKKQLRDSLLISPIDGMVSEIFVDPGEQITVGMEVISILTKGGFIVEAEIPESDIAKVSVGGDVTITLDAYPEEKFYGKVLSIALSALIRDGVVYYTVDIFPNIFRKEVRPHMTANITLIASEKKNVLFIPKRSIREENGKKFVRVFLPRGVEEKEIATGFFGDGGMVEVKEGLEEGQEVIIFDRSEKTTKF